MSLLDHRSLTLLSLTTTLALGACTFDDTLTGELDPGIDLSSTIHESQIQDEWLRYEAAVGGHNYRVRMRFARGEAATSRVWVTVDGTKVGADAYLAGTGSWDSYAIVDASPSFSLPKGKHDVGLHFETGSVNVDWFELVPAP